jgi:hypothetical protein
MKRFLLILLVINPLISFCQDPVYSDKVQPAKFDKKSKNGLPKNARVISVSTDLNKDQLYQKTARLILEKGFTLRASDPLIGIIQSGHKKVRGGWWLKVTATIDDNVVKFTGLAAGQRYGGRELTNSGANKYIFAFDAMNELAESIPHNKIEYLP